MTALAQDLASDYHLAMVGNGRTCALIDASARIVFCCLPDFDSGTVFASILDEEKGGSFGIEMPDGQVTAQSYEKNTNVLVTRFEGESGAFDLIDFMPRYVSDGSAGYWEDAGPDVCRVLRPVRGQPKVVVRFDPRLEYGQGVTETTLQDGGLKATTRWIDDEGGSVYESMYLWTDLPSEAVRDAETLVLDEERFLFLSYHDKVQPPNHDLVDLMLQQTRAYWLTWVARTHKTSEYREQVVRSALVLKMLQFCPTGAMLAAATTSLPETIGSERNWDYRFCWIRDGAMTVSVLNKIGHPSMASRFIDWMLRTVPTKDDSLQIMYGLRGERDLRERSLDHLSGYQNSKPVRVGNAAFNQAQHDIYGVLMDVIYQDLIQRERSVESLDRIWTQVRSVVRIVLDTWEEPDRGIWEIRGKKRQFVFSKVLCWVAIDRAVRIASLLGKEKWRSDHLGILEEMHASIVRQAWNEKKGAFVQYYGADDLDASNLLMAEYGFIDPTDERFISTVKLTRSELCVEGLIFRYRNQDDFGEPESAFTVCSFWLVKALAQIGMKDEARSCFETLLGAANLHGLYGEDLDIHTRRHLGNFPQAYCHLALVDCALALSGDEAAE